MERQKPRIANTTLKEKNKIKGLILPDFKTSQSYTNQDNVALTKKKKKRQTNPRNTLKNPEIHSQKYSQLICQKAEAIQWSK